MQQGTLVPMAATMATGLLESQFLLLLCTTAIATAPLNGAVVGGSGPPQRHAAPRSRPSATGASATCCQCPHCACCTPSSSGTHAAAGFPARASPCQDPACDRSMLRSTTSSIDWRRGAGTWSDSFSSPSSAVDVGLVGMKMLRA
jgi:hypothetical protein